MLTALCLKVDWLCGN